MSDRTKELKDSLDQILEKHPEARAILDEFESVQAANEAIQFAEEVLELLDEDDPAMKFLKEHRPFILGISAMIGSFGARHNFGIEEMKDLITMLQAYQAGVINALRKM
jgi:hypothetical protein